MAYVDYDYYTGTYLGTSIPQSGFDAAAERASDILDDLTFDRIVRDGYQADEKIKKACCALAEQWYQIDQRGGMDIASESVGSHSITYRGTETGGGVYAEYLAIAARYLGPTGLLFRGIYNDDNQC